MNLDALPFDDPGWIGLQGGYHVPYDPRPALEALERGTAPKSAWAELWNELHHQGDVGAASYAAVPHLVRIHVAHGVPDSNTYAMVALIDECRQDGRNPVLPDNLRDGYLAALRQLMELALVELVAATDPRLVSDMIGLVMAQKGQRTLAKFAILYEEKERKALLDEAGLP